LHTYAPHAGLAPTFPCATIVHVPGVALQTSHPPAQLPLQQTPSTQLPLAHCVPAVHPCPAFARHAPLAEQVFVPPHVSRSSALATVVHVPGVAAHVWQLPVQPPLQQYPSLHANEPEHSRHPATMQSPELPMLQEPPCARRAWQIPPAAQKKPLAQSVSTAQVVGQLPDVPSQKYVPHAGLAPLEPFATLVHVPGVALQTSQPPAHGLSQQ
jgi:hypothetical protein